MNRTILSYKDWLVENKNVTSIDEPYKIYLDYVNAWYEKSFNGKSTAELTSEEYREFLITLKVITTDESINKFIENLDYTNSDEVETSIPFFAKNLRDIARYISRKRGEGKYATIDYRYLNSNQGLSSSIYRQLLEIYIADSKFDSGAIDKNISRVSIEIEELYDSNEYYDKDPSKPASDYFDIEANAKYYDKCDPDFLQWAISSGFNNLYSNNDSINSPVSGDLPLSGYMDYKISGTQLEYFKGNIPTYLMGEDHFIISADDIPSDLDALQVAPLNWSSAGIPNLSTNWNPWSSGQSGFIGPLQYPLDEPSTLDVILPLLSESSAVSKFKTMERYATTAYPWINLSNRYFPTIASLPLIDTVHSKRDVGGFMIPSKLGMPIALGRNKFYDANVNTDDSSSDTFPNPDLYSNGYSFSKNYQDSPIKYNSYLNWIDTRQSSGRGSGILASTAKYQEMSPYQTTQESTGFSYLGLSHPNDRTDPWYLKEDNKWEDDTNFPPDFRDIYDIDLWYSTVVSLTGHEDQWAIDIYGNNFALYKDTNNDSIYDRRTDDSGQLFIRNTSGRVALYSDYFSDSIAGSLNGFNLDRLVSFDIYNDIIIMEDNNGSVAVQKITLGDGDYEVNSRSTFTTLSIESAGEYLSFDHCFDDRTEDLYIARREATLTNGFLEIVVYKYSNDRFIEVYDTRSDRSSEMTTLRSNFTFTNIVPFQIMRVSPTHDLLYLTYKAESITSFSSQAANIVTIPISLVGESQVDEIIVVTPEKSLINTGLAQESERIYLIDIMVGDNLNIMLEGSVTRNKYLEVIPL